MNDPTAPGPIRTDLKEEADRIIQWATRRGIVLRALGGIAIKHCCPSSEKPDFNRLPKDLDFIGRKKQSRELKALFEDLGYVPEKGFNALHGHRRLLFLDPNSAQDVDIFLDHFEMSHDLPLAGRLEQADWAIPVADLLLTKLQVAEINPKDLLDAACILLDHPLADKDGPGQINARWVAELCAQDWGLHTTVLDNLAEISLQLSDLATSEADQTRILERVQALQKRILAEPKTVRWKMRNVIGRRVRWYETPEETRGQGPIKLE
ncbi:MAG: hypothetical protein PVI59_02630 [Anaerolineae bacterium]|jgi:hypothetical protein